MRLPVKSICFILLLHFSCTQAQDFEKSVRDNVASSFVESEIHYLAHDDMKGRDTGSPELIEAASHATSLFEKWQVQTAPGLTSYLQKVPLIAYYPPASATVAAGKKSWKEYLLVWDSENGQVNGSLIFAGFGGESDFAPLDVKGKIVVLRGGTPDNPVSSPGVVKEKTRRALENGAAGIIELTTFSSAHWAYYKTFLSKKRVIAAELNKGEKTLPYLWLNDPDKKSISQLTALAGQTAEITIEGSRKEPVESYNVVGYVPGTDKELNEEIVLLSAHYDHVGVGAPGQAGDSIYNGARDNAVGAVAVLSAAKAAAKQPARRSFIFVLFTGEEKGMIGSQYFSENSPVPLDRIVFNLNSDNAGYNDTTMVTVVGLSRTNTTQALENGSAAFGLKAVEDPAPEQNLFDRSDNVQFAKKGIPAPTFSMGFTAFDAEIGQYYHQPADEAASLSFDYVLKFIRAYTYSAFLIANMEERPFWMEGDKYYEQGLELYGNSLPAKK